jgi:glycosyltransferase involved in cell wall biosynthesis
MSRPRISILAANCTIHSLARPRLLSRLLAPDFEVEVVAPVFPGDEDVYRDAEWPGRYVPVPVRKLPGFARSVNALLEACTGDVVYALKAKPTSLGVALLGRRQRDRPVVVDLDDREIYHCYPYSHHASKNFLLSYPEWAHPNAYPLTHIAEMMVTRADHVTSVSSHFQRLFGGTIVPQAVDTDVFDPSRFDGEGLRRVWGLDQCRVVMFLGRPLPHKGLDEILEAVEMSRHPDVRLVVVGGETPYVEEIRHRSRVVYLGWQPFDMAPAFLSVADVVMLPQRPGPISAGQMPTKIPEAMAMGVPVISTSISDIPEQVGDSGVVVSPGDVPALAQALDRLLDDDGLRREMGQSARRRSLARDSMTAVRPVIRRVFSQVIGAPTPVAQGVA